MTTEHQREMAAPEAAGTASFEFSCPRCAATHTAVVSRAPGGGEPAGPAPGACPGCGFPFATAGDDALEPGRAVAACRVCGTKELYIQKDFNRELGFAIVATSFFATFLAMALYDHRAGLYLLFALAVIDFFVYLRLRNVTVCYLCHTIYRGFPLHPEHRGFYLGSEEKYKPRRQEWLQNASEAP